MSENIYAKLKGRFPILNNMRLHVHNSMKVVIVCYILHNIGILLNDGHGEFQMPDNRLGDEQDLDHAVQENVVRRILGQNAREDTLRLFRLRQNIN